VRLGVNVPNFGPGARPQRLRSWAQTVEGLGYDLLMMSDHVVITSDVARYYPAPFYEPLTTLSWLAGTTDRILLGTTVLIAPYRHPLLTARMAANLNELSDGRLVLGVGVGWARQEFDALGVPFVRRGALTDEYLRAMRAAWENEADYGQRRIPVWIGGNSDSAIARAAELGDAWHPLQLSKEAMGAGLERLRALSSDRPPPAFAPRIRLRLVAEPLDSPERPVGAGDIDQVVQDLADLRDLGADTVILDPYHGDPAETSHPEGAWQALATVAATDLHVEEPSA
jgi:alkanesulfonate monooxygenase SsuD/methylene tetrahydromethanopterin reductase-like flavin-dependent oxidoreductase (luciferase family)